MKRILKRIILTLGIISFVGLIFYSTADAKQKDSEDEQNTVEEFVIDPEEFPYAEENESCFRCHGEKYYTERTRYWHREKTNDVGSVQV